MNLDKACALVREAEGLKLKAYLCPAEKLTIGYGHTSGVKRGDVCTIEQAEKWLQEDIQKAAECVKKNVKVPLSNNQLNALASFVFNVGAGKVGVKDGFVYLKNGQNSTLLKQLNRGWYETVPVELMRWVYSKGEILGGLSRRRAAEAVLFNKTGD